jgi:BCD family chlorophyll transporter-like MFS transporter
MGYSPGRSTSLSGVQHGGVLLGMLLAALAGRRWRGIHFGSLHAWTVGGCVLSALAMVGLAASGLVGPTWPFQQTVFVLGAWPTGRFPSPPSRR